MRSERSRCSSASGVPASPPVSGPIDAPGAALALHGLAQRHVGLEDVVGHERRRLVQDLMGVSLRQRRHAMASSTALVGNEFSENCTRLAMRASCRPRPSRGRAASDPTSASPRPPTSRGQRLHVVRPQLAGGRRPRARPRRRRDSPTQPQALRLDGGVDRLGEKREAEHGPRQRPAAERLDRGGNTLGRGPPVRGRHLDQHVELALRGA